MRGPCEYGIVNTYDFEKTIRPVRRFHRLQNDGISLPTNGHRGGFETEFVRKMDSLTMARFDNLRSFHDFTGKTWGKTILNFTVTEGGRSTKEWF